MIIKIFLIIFFVSFVAIVIGVIKERPQNIKSDYYKKNDDDNYIYIQGNVNNNSSNQTKIRKYDITDPTEEEDNPYAPFDSKEEKEKWEQGYRKAKATQIYRKDNKPNNMNCDRYKFSGKYSKTGKMRTKKEAYVFPGEDPLQVIKDMGYEDPIEYEYDEWPVMSDKQIKLLYDRSGGKFQRNMCSQDASAMIDRLLDHTFNADPGLFEYAKTMRIPASHYCTKYRLSGMLLHDLEGKDKIAFQIYYAYCDIQHEEIKNLLVDPLKNLFYKYAEERLVDNEFDILDYLKRGGSGYKPETKGWDIAKEFLVREGIIEEKKILKKNKSQKKS